MKSSRVVMSYCRVHAFQKASARFLCPPAFILLPSLHFFLDASDDIVHFAALAKCIDEVPLRVHEVEEYGVIHKIVILSLHVGWCREIYAVGLACRLDRCVVTSEAHEARMEVSDIGADLRDGVTSRIDGDEYRLDDGTVDLV